MDEQKQIKSKDRVADHGEVFTAEREVKAMCDLVAQECEKIDSTFLEPACGEGNFLTEILARKLETVKRRYGKSSYDYEYNAIIALSSIYGVDIMADNAEKCRERLFAQWDEAYTKTCKKDCCEEARAAARFILDRNIICGNALSFMQVDETQQDTDKPILFAEWSFLPDGKLIQRKDFRFDVLLKENKDDENYEQNYSIFGEEVFGDPSMDSSMWLIDPITHEPTPRPVQEYPPIYYRRLAENG